MRRVFAASLNLSLGLALCTCGAKKPVTAASQAIGPSGGTVKTAAVTISVPAGALATATTITVTDVSANAPDGYTGLSPLYQFGPDGTVFAKPITVTLNFSNPATAPTVNWSNASGGYDELPTTISGTQAEAQVSHFSRGFVAEHVAKNNQASAEKALTAFSFAALAAQGTIDEDAKTIAITVPFATDVTALVAAFTTTGASVAVGATAQVSGTTANDFTNPVVYTVTAADDSTVDYTVTVTVALSSAKALTAFSFPAISAVGTIDEETKTITVGVDLDTDVTTLVATFTSTGANVTVASVAQVSGTTSNDFTSPLAYVVTALDASTASYTVTVGSKPAAPVISFPNLDDVIAAPATVQGTATANATINIAVLNGASQLGTGSGTADASGVFNLQVPSYTTPEDATVLTLSVTQSVNGVASDPVTLEVLQGFAATVPFEASQTTGATTATTMYLQIFAHGTTTLAVQTHAFSITAGSPAPLNQFAFTLPVWTTGDHPTLYYDFFAFCDENNNGVFDSGEPSSNNGAPLQEAIFMQNATHNFTMALPALP